MDTTEAVRSALCTQYIKTLLRTKSHQLARQARFRDSERPDLEQDLLAHVLKQAHHYDPSRASVNTFIDRVVASAFAMMVRSRRRLKRAAGFGAVSLDNTFVGRERDGLRTPLSHVVQEGHLPCHGGTRPPDDQERIDLAFDVARAMESLTPRQREIARRLASDSEAAVARKMGISRRRVRQAVEAIREHFERAGLKKSPPFRTDRPRLA